MATQKKRRWPNRMARLKWLCTPAGMREAARVQAIRRGAPGEHRYVVGQFFLIGGRVTLRGVRMGFAYEVPRPPEYTDQAAAFFRWRTRQAAHQFATRWRIAEFHVIDMAYLDVLPDAMELPSSGKWGNIDTKSAKASKAPDQAAHQAS